MPKYEIKKTIECTLLIECDSIEKAKNWGDCIVATIECDKENVLEHDKFILFEAETFKDGLTVEIASDI